MAFGSITKDLAIFAVLSRGVFTSLTLRLGPEMIDQATCLEVLQDTNNLQPLLDHCELEPIRESASDWLSNP